MDSDTAEQMVKDAGGGEVEVWGKNAEGEWELLTTMAVDENMSGNGVWDESWNNMELRYDLTGVLIEGQMAELSNPITIAQGGGLNKPDSSSFEAIELGRNSVPGPGPGPSPGPSPSFSPGPGTLPSPGTSSIVGSGTGSFVVSGTTPSASTTEGMSPQVVAEGVKAALDSYSFDDGGEMEMELEPVPDAPTIDQTGKDALEDLVDAESRLATATAGFIDGLQGLLSSLQLTFPSSQGAAVMSFTISVLGKTYTIAPPSEFWSVTRALARLVYVAMAVAGAYALVRYVIS